MQYTTLIEHRGKMILSIDTEKEFDKSTPFHDKIFSKLGIEGKFLDVIKGIYVKPTANILIGETL